jgi:hypothetical protein
MSIDEDGVVNFIFAFWDDEIRFCRWFDGQSSAINLITDGHLYPYLGLNEAIITTRPDGASTAVWPDQKQQDGNYGSDEIWACRMLD